jgi:hypothetical protein
VFELSYGKPAETPQGLPEDIDPFQIASVTPLERARLVARVVAKYPHLAPLAPTVELVPEEHEPATRLDRQAADDPHPRELDQTLETPNRGASHR